jgi:hypothetical protein
MGRSSTVKNVLTVLLVFLLVWSIVWGYFSMNTLVLGLGVVLCALLVWSALTSRKWED